jgi:hypothetical protein
MSSSEAGSRAGGAHAAPAVPLRHWKADGAQVVGGQHRVEPGTTSL